MNVERRRIGAVVLTYNSSDELADCLACLTAQRDVDLRVIVVDNASTSTNRAAMEKIFLQKLPDGIISDATDACADLLDTASALFLRNLHNSGYSAGNNIGARLAVSSGCEAVLILNPDVRIEDPYYLAALVELINADAETAVACSAVTNLSGANENPMVEPSFVEELLWPVTMVFGRFLPKHKKVIILPSTPFMVEKVTGACFLIRADFLRRIGFFDESVFLYCEESILSAQVRAAGWHMMMDPGRHALHAHRTCTKGNQLTRFRNWARSRGQFHAAHSGYGTIRQTLLAGSRVLILALIWLKTVLLKHGRTIARQS